jgi:3-phosphoshikimate 1-carboxyvinyltransferase
MHRALRAMGADVEQRDDGLVIRGGRLHGATLDSRSDHRMVMTLAVAGLVADGTTVVSNVECVRKTFPAFVAEMQGIGGDMEKRS